MFFLDVLLDHRASPQTICPINTLGMLLLYKKELIIATSFYVLDEVLSVITIL